MLFPSIATIGARDLQSFPHKATAKNTFWTTNSSQMLERRESWQMPLQRVSILNVSMYICIPILILTHPIGNVVRRADGVVVGSHVDGVPGRGRLGGPPRHMRRRRVRTGPKTLLKTKCNDCSRSHMYIPALSRPS